MQKESTSSNQKEIKKNKREEKQPMAIDSIREIARLIADSSYDGCYTLERYTESLYRFGFGTSESGDISMFEGKTANEAMYRAIDFELTTEIKLLSREKLTKLAEDRLVTIKDEQQKRKGMEEKFAAKNIEYKDKELMKERDGLKQEREAISSIINRVTDRWKDDKVMQSFEKEIAAWKKRPSVFIGFILENIEKLMYEKIPYAAPSKKIKKMVEKREEDLLEVKEHPLKKVRILAMVNKDVSILEPLWNDLQDSIMDGEWHAFSEANEIIRRHGYRQLAMNRISQIRQAYFKFAKDKKYYTARGKKDYLFDWKRIEGVNKFCFTTAGEEVKPEKRVEKGLELGRKLDYVSEHPIHENPRDEFVRLFCDGKWHPALEPVEMLKKYDNYNRCKQSSLPPLRSAYIGHVRKFYHMIKEREGRTYKFKFDKKFDKTELAKIKEGKPIKSPNGVKCARCGQAIRYDEKCHQVDNLFYHPDCYKAMKPKQNI